MKRTRNGKSPRRKKAKTTTVSFYAGVPRSRRTKTERLSEELKFFDTDIVDGAIDNTMTFFNPMIVVQGQEESQRIGRKIVIKSLSLKGTLTLAAAVAGTTTSCLVTMKIIQDKATNKTLFPVLSLLEADTFDSFNNLANRTRFKVLRSCTYRFKAGGGTDSAAILFSEDIRHVEEHLNMNLPIEYDNTAATGAITTVTQNSLHVVFQASTTNLVASDIKMRIRYTD